MRQEQKESFKRYSFDSMEKLPLEITENILFRLPMVSQLQGRELCKTWQTILPKPKKGLLYGVSCRNNKVTDATEIEFYFSEEKSVVNTTKLDHNLVMPASVFRSFMVGSCNGLVCYAGDTAAQREPEIYVCNPVSGENIHLPNMKSIDVLWPSTTMGFGYTASSKEYKVVSIQWDYHNQDQKVVQVYTLLQGGGGTGWRNISSTIKKGLMSQFNDFLSPGVFIGGVLHWFDESNIKANILAFDLEHETFELLPSIPPDDVCDSDVSYRFKLMDLGGNLCLLLSDPNKDEIIIWELTQSKMDKHGPYWRRRFTLAWEDDSWWSESYLPTECNVILSCYDPETRTLRNLEENLIKFEDEARVYTTPATPHVNSLVSLKEITEKRGGKKRKALEEPERENFVATT